MNRKTPLAWLRSNGLLISHKTQWAADSSAGNRHQTWIKRWISVLNLTYPSGQPHPAFTKLVKVTYALIVATLVPSDRPTHRRPSDSSHQPLCRPLLVQDSAALLLLGLQQKWHQSNQLLLPGSQCSSELIHRTTCLRFTSTWLLAPLPERHIYIDWL